MKWRYPQNGERRTRRRFAWLPVCASDGYVYWLEWVIREEYYRDWGFEACWRTLRVLPAREGPSFSTEER